MLGELREYYRLALETHLPSEEGLFDPPSPVFIDAVSRLTQADHEPERLKPALDVGFGNGQYAIALAKMGYSVDCVDIVVADSVKRSIAASGLLQKIRFHELPIEQFSMERGYSVVVAKDILHFCERDWLESWLESLTLTAPLGALHYLSVFTDIERLDANGRKVRLDGEANFSKLTFSSFVQNCYTEGWRLDMEWRKHEQHSYTTGHRYFSAWRCSLFATKVNA